MQYPRQLPPKDWGQDYFYVLDGELSRHDEYINTTDSFCWKDPTYRGSWINNPAKNIVWRLPTPRSASNMELTYINGRFSRYGTDPFGREYLDWYNPYEPEGSSVYVTDNYPYWGSDGSTGTDYNLRNRCDTESLLKLIDGNLQLGADIAEGKKTLAMIAKRSSQVLRAYKRAKRLDWKGVAHALEIDHKSFKKASKDISGRWLEVQYGWQPLLGTISDSANLLRKYATETWYPRAVVRTVTVPVDVKTSIGDEVTKHCFGTYSIRNKLWFRINDPTLHMLSQLGLTNPASIAWELTPFSFVLDWFIPVGNFIEAWTATLGLEFLSGTRTTRHSGHVRFHQSRENDYSDINCTSIYRTNGYRREVLTEFPLPQVYVKSPFSSGHTINALALINQRWK